MRLFLDTEFNSFGGELISIALVSDDGREWYRKAPCGPDFYPWVAESVIPHLDAVREPTTCTPIDQDALAAGLASFLDDFPNVEIIADWPADFEHFANLLSIIGKNGGYKEAFPCTMRLINTPELKPEVPHNALSDARALRDWFVAQVNPVIGSAV